MLTQFGLGFGELGLGAFQLVLVVVLLHLSEKVVLGDVVALLQGALVAVDALTLGEGGDVAIDLKGHLHLDLGNDVGGIARRIVVVL